MSAIFDGGRKEAKKRMWFRRAVKYVIAFSWMFRSMVRMI